MTPLVLEAVKHSAKPENYIWFDVGRLATEATPLLNDELLAVPYSNTSLVGIDDDGRTLFAGPQAAGRAHEDLTWLHAALHQSHVEGHEQLRRASRAARLLSRMRCSRSTYEGVPHPLLGSPYGTNAGVVQQQTRGQQTPARID